MDRRTFLTLSLAATAGLLTSCESQNALIINLLQGSIPPQLIGDFKKSLAEGKTLDLKPKEQLAPIFELLQALHSPENKKQSWLDALPFIGSSAPSSESLMLATLGDAWLETAITENLIQPLDPQDIPTWSQLPPRWQKFVTRNSLGKMDTAGKVYAAPYRFGSMAIAYRQDKVQSEISEWADLWRDELKGRLSLLDDYRAVVGLTLKKLGHSFNTQDLSKVNNLETELEKLDQQVRFYSSDGYLQPLVLGDTWAAVGWSSDFLAIRDRYPDLKIVIPPSGTSLWADLWVLPQATPANLDNEQSQSKQQDSNLAMDWIDFCWQAKAAKQILLFTDGISPIFTTQEKTALAQDLTANPVTAATISSFEQSEFITSLEPEINQQYLNLWQKIRES